MTGTALAGPNGRDAAKGISRVSDDSFVFGEGANQFGSSSVDVLDVYKSPQIELGKNFQEQFQRQGIERTGIDSAAGWPRGTGRF